MADNSILMIGGLAVVGIIAYKLMSKPSAETGTLTVQTAGLSQNTTITEEVPAGTYTITFGNVTGYITPDPQDAVVTANQTTTISGTYVVGGKINITVTGLPSGTAAAVTTSKGAFTYTANAPYSLNVSPGTYTITYGDVSGYITPSPDTAVVAAGDTINISQAYEAEPPSPGRLELYSTGLPSGTKPAVTLSQGGFTYTATIPLALNLDPGTYNLRYGDITGYVTPTADTVTITSLHTTTKTVNYAPAPINKGTLNVDVTGIPGGTTAPNSTVTGTGYNQSGKPPLSLSLNPGTYTITYGSLTGYTTPTADTAVVVSNQTTNVTGDYAIIPPSQGTLDISVSGLPTGTTANVTVTQGTNTYIAAAPYAIDLDPGTYNITYEDLTGYITPSPDTAVITANQTTTKTGTYTVEPPPTGNLVQNPNFDNNYTSWSRLTGNGRTYSIIDSGTSEGNYAHMIIPAGLSGNISQSITLVGSHNIDFSAYYVSPEKSPYMTLVCFNAGGTQIQTTSVYVYNTPADTFLLGEIQITTPENTAYVQINLGITNNTSSPVTASFDHIILTAT